jgi:hypothetical protein
MKRAKWILAIVVIIVVTLPICFCCFVANYGAFPPFLVAPSTRRIARRYLIAVTAGDVEAAVELAGSDKGCRRVMREMAEEDISLLGNADIRKVRIGVGASTGSREELEFADVWFEYRISADGEWQKGKIRLMTDYESWPANGWPPGERYACGPRP